MAVPTPLSATAGDKLSATTFNGGVRDPLNFLMNPPRCHVYNNATQSFVNGAALALMLWDSEIYDTDSMHSTTTNTGRITFTTAGTYEVDALISFATGTYTALSMQCALNAAGVAGGGTLIRTQLYQDGPGNLGPFTFQRFFTAGDYIEFFATQTSGGNKSTAASPYGSRVITRWVAST